LRLLDKKFIDDEVDFDVPISKYYRLIKRSVNDFDIIQISKPPKLLPIPKFDFKQNTKGGAQASGEIRGEPTGAANPEIEDPKVGREETKDQILACKEEKEEKKRNIKTNENDAEKKPTSVPINNAASNSKDHAKANSKPDKTVIKNSHKGEKGAQRSSSELVKKEPAQKEDKIEDKGQIKIDEEAKPSGCNCLLL
jgi:hypothetical protein